MKPFFSLSLITFSLIGLFAMPAMASVMVVGPEGEVISFVKRGPQIEVRFCLKNTMPSEIENSNGCTVKDGTEPGFIDESAFLPLFQKATQSIDDSLLAKDEKTFLDQYLSSLSIQGTAPREQNTLKDLEERLKKVQSFKALYPNDYDVATEKSLIEQITALKSSLRNLNLDIESKMNTKINNLMSYMSGEKVNLTLVASKDKETIHFQALLILANTDNSCEQLGLTNSQAGTVCSVDAFSTWKMMGTNKAGRKYLLDMRTGRYVTVFENRPFTYRQAEHACVPDGKINWHLPSGWPERRNGELGIGNSELQSLVDSGLLRVMPKSMGNYLIWSSTLNPDAADGDTYTMHGHDGFLGRLNTLQNTFYDNLRNVNMETTVLCVGN